MQITFAPMTRTHAEQIVANWKYPGEYAGYDYTHEAEYMLKEANWGKEIFAALDEVGELIGELCVNFRDDTTTYTGNPADTLWIGFGLRPDLTGRGLGQEYVLACVDFAVRHFAYQRPFICLGVTDFNLRARKVYERCGFEQFRTEDTDFHGRKCMAIYMQKRLA